MGSLSRSSVRGLWSPQGPLEPLAQTQLILHPGVGEGPLPAPVKRTWWVGCCASPGRDRAQVEGLGRGALCPPRTAAPGVCLVRAWWAHLFTRGNWQLLA